MADVDPSDYPKMPIAMPREEQVDRKPRSGTPINTAPMTLMEEKLAGGRQRINEPVGGTPAPDWTSGTRGSDTV